MRGHCRLATEQRVADASGNLSGKKRSTASSAFVFRRSARWKECVATDERIIVWGLGLLAVCTKESSDVLMLRIVGEHINLERNLRFFIVILRNASMHGWRLTTTPIRSWGWFIANSNVSAQHGTSNKTDGYPVLASKVLRSTNSSSAVSPQQRD